MALGSFIVYISFQDFNPKNMPLEWGIPIYVSMGLSVVNLVLPMDSLNKKLFKMPKDD